MPAKSAIPSIYYAIFAFYEPFLCVSGLLGAMFNPQKTYNSLAPWPSGTSKHDLLPPATMVTLMQLAHACALLGIINTFVLSAARHHLIQPPVQEKIVASLLTPLLFGDIFHVVLTLYGLGEYRWNLSDWPAMLWFTNLIGFTLFIPRICWHLGLGRYVASRDGHFDRKL